MNHSYWPYVERDDAIPAMVPDREHLRGFIYDTNVKGWDALSGWSPPGSNNPTSLPESNPFGA